MPIGDVCEGDAEGDRDDKSNNEQPAPPIRPQRGYTCSIPSVSSINAPIMTSAKEDRPRLDTLGALALHLEEILAQHMRVMQSRFKDLENQLRHGCQSGVVHHHGPRHEQDNLEDILTSRHGTGSQHIRPLLAQTMPPPTTLLPIERVTIDTGPGGVSQMQYQQHQIMHEDEDVMIPGVSVVSEGPFFALDESLWTPLDNINIKMLPAEVEDASPVQVDEMNSEGRLCHYDSVRSGTTNASKAAPQRVGKCICRPSSFPRFAWDLTGLALIMVDMVLIPFALAFDFKETPLTLCIFWVILMYWTFDIGLSFRTGFYRAGAEVLDHRKIAFRYIRGWFAVDLAIVGMDWASLFLENRSGAGLARFGKGLRAVRVVRSIRLIRMVKLKRALNQLQDHIVSEVGSVSFTIAKMFCAVLLVSHFIACGWYALGESSEGSVLGWVDAWEIAGRALLYRYLTSLHWTLTQFSTGSMEVSAGTTQERLFSVLTLVFSLLVFSSCVSSITGAMGHLRKVSSAHNQDLADLRRYLRSHGVRPNLSIRILRFANHQVVSRKKEIQESDVKLLSLLSQPLQMELRQCLHQPLLAGHHFFALYHTMDQMAMQQAIADSVSLHPLSPRDVLFSQRANANYMYFLSKGHMSYQAIIMRPRGSTISTQGSPSSTPAFPTSISGMIPLGSYGRRVRHGNAPERSTSPRVLEATPPTSKTMSEAALRPKDWCAEGALWTRWIHLGTMRAASFAEVLALDAHRFAEATAAHQRIYFYAVTYAANVIQLLNTLASSGHLSDLRLESADVLATDAYKRAWQAAKHGSGISGSGGGGGGGGPLRSSGLGSPLSPSMGAEESMQPTASQGVSPQSTDLYSL